MRFRYLLLLPVLAFVLAGCNGTDNETAATPATPAGEYAAFVLRCCDETEARIPELTKLAEQVAEMHAGGGRLGVIWDPPSSTGPQGPQYEMKGRSGGFGAFDVNLAKQPNADRTKDVAIVGYQRTPEPAELEILKKYREKYFIIAFGPKELPALADYVKLCDAWVDTGLGADDRAVTLPGGTRAGQGNALVNSLNTWAFLGELTAALTRKGKMPVLLMSHSLPKSDAWNNKYRGKTNFHDDLQVKPIAAGTLSREYLQQIRDLVKTFAATQQPAIDQAVGLIVEELKQGKKTVVAQTGHTTFELVGKYEDAAWAQPVVFYETTGRIKQYPELTADGALVLRLGYSGMEPSLMDVLKQKKQRVMIITSNHDARPEYKVPDEYAPVIDMGWDFGDACVQIEGYPIRVFPPSGVMQIVAYEAVNVEVLARLANAK